MANGVVGAPLVGVLPQNQLPSTPTSPTSHRSIRISLFAVATNHEHLTHENKLTLRQSMDKLARKSTPPKVNVQSTTTANDPWLSWYPLVDYVNARNSPGARPYCNCQPLKKISWIKQNHKKFNATKNFFTQIIFKMWKFPDLRHQLPMKVSKEMQK